MTQSGIGMLDASDRPLIAPVTDRVSSIVVDGEYVYWACSADYPCAISKISSVTGATSQVVGANSTCGLAVDERSVYWCETNVLYRADK